MLYVVDIMINLISSLLLSKNGFKLVFKNEKFILYKNTVFIKEGYLRDDIFKMNIMTIITINEKKNNYNAYSSYLFKFYDMWYDMLGHVNYNFLQRLLNLDLLPSMR
jgi:hypothetical protein